MGGAYHVTTLHERGKDNPRPEAQLRCEVRGQCGLWSEGNYQYREFEVVSTHFNRRFVTFLCKSYGSPMQWLPEPVWWEVAGLGIEYRALYAGLSFWVAVLLFGRRTLKEGGNAELIVDWVPYGIAGTMLGARLGYFALEIPRQFIAEPGGLLWQPGFSFHGAVLGLLGATAAFGRRNGLSLPRLFDQLAWAASIAFLFMSFAALLSNEVAGVESRSFFSMEFPLYDEGNLDPPRRFAVHHLQAVWAIVVVAVIGVLEHVQKKRLLPPGILVALTILLIFSGLLFLDPFKEQVSHVAQASYRTTAIVLDLLFVCAGTLGLLVPRFMRREGSRDGSASA
jgi:phosphatidylglycerol---prolipoprotein diacylglyceryl transferase